MNDITCEYCGSRNHSVTACQKDAYIIDYIMRDPMVDRSRLESAMRARIDANDIHTATELVWDIDANDTITPPPQIPPVSPPVRRAREQMCPICYTDVSDIDICVTRCGHTFCMTCLCKHVDTSFDCPMCRQTFVEFDRDGYNYHPSRSSYAPSSGSGAASRTPSFDDPEMVDMLNNGMRIEVDQLDAMMRDYVGRRPDNGSDAVPDTLIGAGTRNCPIVIDNPSSDDENGVVESM